MQATGTGTLTEPLTDEQIAALPMYEWEVAEVGDAAPPFTIEVTPALIARYCEAVRNDNPLSSIRPRRRGGRSAESLGRRPSRSCVHRCVATR